MFVTLFTSMSTQANSLNLNSSSPSPIAVINNLMLKELKSHCPSLTAQHKLIISYIKIDFMESLTLLQEIKARQVSIIATAIDTFINRMLLAPFFFNSCRLPSCSCGRPSTILDSSKDELTRLSEDPDIFYKEIDEHRNSSHCWPFDKNLLSLSLCKCPKMSSALRTFTSKASLEQLTQLRNQESLLTLVSVGMGEGYHEIAYVIVPFARAGFKKMKVVCIDASPATSTVVTAMTRFCRNTLPQCNIEFHKFSTLTDYALQAQHSTLLRPNLLLLLDLTDEQYYIDDESFRDFSFSFLQMHNLLSPGTVIAYSTYERTFLQAIRATICCTYQNPSVNLKDIMRRNEFIEILEGSPNVPTRNWTIRESYMVDSVENFTFGLRQNFELK